MGLPVPHPMSVKTFSDSNIPGLVRAYPSGVTTTDIGKQHGRTDRRGGVRRSRGGAEVEEVEEAGEAEEGGEGRRREEKGGEGR